MKLTRIIPAKKQTIDVLIFKRFGYPYKAYREVCSRLERGAPKSCYWCNSKFEDDSDLYTVIWNKRAESFCSECVKPLQENATQNKEGKLHL